ncbi:unnamed protein product [Schistosoma curassoni]|uniref:DUF6451 domain-containing protein n=1 Tax=Schistosoma curassoni TaxID=6186 RepID=A0A183JTH3_9TREM|nr:unnamed protein product [Schistosoma curassoni]
MQLDDLDLVNGVALLSHTQQQMQAMTTSVAAASASVCLNIHREKNKMLKKNMKNTNPITLNREALEEVETLTCLNSTIDEQRGCDADVNTSIGKTRTAFLRLKNIWKSKQLSTRIKAIIFSENVKTVLLYGPETSRSTTTIIKW